MHLGVRSNMVNTSVHCVITMNIVETLLHKMKSIISLFIYIIRFLYQQHRYVFFNSFFKFIGDFFENCD